MTITKEQLEKLILKAKEGMEQAYSIHFKFPVGAAVLTKKGNYYQGCNQEDIISGMGECAERNAISHAFAHGDRLITAIAIISRNEEPITPCGMCRQAIYEVSQLHDYNIEIYRIGSSGKIIKRTIEELLPEPTGPKQLGIDLSEWEG